MKKLILVVVVLVSTYVYAQNQSCIVSSPSSPPHATQLVITLAGDGGATGCTAHGTTPNGARPTEVAIGNAKCAVAVQIAEQSVANDNGWNDGGQP